jgi:hypothetical protein
MTGSPFSHPESAVRHSYPLAIGQAGFGTALSLVVRTLPYALARFAILLTFSFVTIVWLVATFGIGAWLGSKVHPFVGVGWMVALLGTYGYLWWFVVRYGLYLVQAGHIAVLTELVTTGQIDNGAAGMFDYGRRVVTERFGQVNLLFAMHVIVRGIVGAFNRTLDWISHLLPVPGLSSLVGIVNAIVRAATTYIDETIFSYNLARGDENPWRSSKDALIYYGQNSMEILKTAAWVVVLDKVLTVVVWAVMLIPAGMLLLVLPTSLKPGGMLLGFVIAALFASNTRQAFLKPIFLTMVMTKFHVVVRGQPIDMVWDSRLSGVSSKFRDLSEKALVSPPLPAAGSR